MLSQPSSVNSRRHTRRLLRWALLLALVFVVALLLMLVAAGWLLAKPAQSDVGSAPDDLRAEAVHFPSESGAEVHGWWCPVPGARLSVLLLPGVRANRLSMIQRARFLRRAGHSVLLIDFQATGETQGERITFGFKESRDVLAAVAFLRKVAPPDGSIAVIGSSLGGAAALLASPRLEVDGLVFEAVYPTIQRATHNRLRKYLGAGGSAVTPLLLEAMRLRLGVSATQLRPIDHVASVGCPVLIINGADDPNTTSDDAAALFARAREPKQLWLVDDAGHVDLHQAATREYEVRVLRFLQSIEAAKASPHEFAQGPSIVPTG